MGTNRHLYHYRVSHGLDKRLPSGSLKTPLHPHLVPTRGYSPAEKFIDHDAEIDHSHCHATTLIRYKPEQNSNHGHCVISAHSSTPIHKSAAAKARF